MVIGHLPNNAAVDTLFDGPNGPVPNVIFSY